MPKALIEEIMNNLRRVFRAVNEQSKKAERETGLTGPQLWTIRTIAAAGTIRVLELAKKMYLTPATVIGILDRLERGGYITRSRSTTDRRVVEVALSDQGRYLLEQAPEVAQGLLVAGLEKIPPEKQREVNDSLLLLVKLLGAQDLPPQLLLSSEVNLPKKKQKQPPHE